jgi:N-methylhydantoinase B
MDPLNPVTLEVLWSRLISIVDEAAAALVRSSFSTAVRESNDFACVLLDREGRSLAQSTRSIPSFTATLPKTLSHMLSVFPHHQLADGDAIVTNDPWMGTGHLNDICMAVPIFSDGGLIGFAASAAHTPDIGGRVRSAENRELYEEGIRIPISKWLDAGTVNRDVEEFIRQNVRVPDQVVGDLYAQFAANRLAARRLTKLLQEHQVEVGPLASAIQSQSEQAMRAALREIPNGSYEHEVWLDGFDEPIVLRVALVKREDTLLADFAGSSPQVPFALNVVLTYTYAYTVYAIKCALSPATPNNEGCFRPLTVDAPLGSILNPRFPAPVGARAMVGHYLPALLMGALHHVVPDRVQAASGSPIWSINCSGVDHAGKRFAGVFFLNGGQGASSRQDGISCLSFPSNASNTPIEIIEHAFPVVIERKELSPDSGGPGTFRGGLGQRMDIRIRSSDPIITGFMGDRTHFPAEGHMGGAPGAPGRLVLNGEPISPKKLRILEPGDILQVFTPGGGGWGDPRGRPRAAVEADLSEGLVTAARASDAYGYAIGASRSVQQKDDGAAEPSTMKGGEVVGSPPRRQPRLA